MVRVNDLQFESATTAFTLNQSVPCCFAAVDRLKCKDVSPAVQPAGPMKKYACRLRIAHESLDYDRDCLAQWNRLLHR